jgi:hypothetical protein
LSAEANRLDEAYRRAVDWKKWGPYLSERSWATVREDYSADGNVWDYFPHDHARSRVFRWGEDGLGGICDREQYLCFAPTLWNGGDSILKERLFGLTGHEGNHGEDVKEYYFYLDNTPTHSYMRMLYKYPQAAYPFEQLIVENRRAGRDGLEFELLDTGLFAENRYFDVTIEYAKADAEDILIRLSIANRGPDTTECYVLPTLWFRNTWSWGYPDGIMGHLTRLPIMRRAEGPDGQAIVRADHNHIGEYTLYADQPDDLLFTNNETNNERLYGAPNSSPYVKDAFHRYLIDGDERAVNPAGEGTKVAFYYKFDVPAGEVVTVRLRLALHPPSAPFAGFDELVEQRRAEADEFYAALHPAGLEEEARRVQRQALAGMLWSKQFYYYDIEQWLAGDPALPSPPDSRRVGRNSEWLHLNTFDVLSMPDKWEYPWFAAWDMGFHTIPLSLVDTAYAKRQLILLTRVWYLHPNGQLPAYEWQFSGVNPPVHAWAAWRVYEMEKKLRGTADRVFLERIFHKLLLNFTWWVNRKDEEGRNVFQGGFLGLDNISVFDRSATLPNGGRIDQSDATAWMGFYSLHMLRIALELAKENPVYQDLGTKFFEHFLSIAYAMTNRGGKGFSLWHEEDGFFYDVLHLPPDRINHLQVRSLVGLIPLLAVETLEPELLDLMPDFHRRLDWFARHRPRLTGNMAGMDVPGEGERLILAIPTRERMLKVLAYLLDEEEFLSDYGVRSLSKYHESHPFSLEIDGAHFSVNYQPAESHDGLFGGNSNWRGPIWMSINYLLIEALRKYHGYYGDSCKVEYPTRSGNWINLEQTADALSRRLIRIFLPDENGTRPLYGGQEIFQRDPHWREHILFHEYFHADNGAGLGASHQTGWTGLIAVLLNDMPGFKD